MEVLQEKHLDTQVSLVGNRTCSAFTEYKDVPYIVPLDFTEYDVTWFSSKLSGSTGALETEAIELGNWPICFRCAL